MKYLLVASLSIFLTQIQAQTALIAHKSHSGSFTNFALDKNSNFGKVYMPKLEPKPVVEEKVEYIFFEVMNDSIVIKQTTGANQELISIDTLTNKEKYSLEEFKVQYEKKKKAQTQIAEPQNTKVGGTKEDSELLEPRSYKKQNQPSFLLIFFAVSAVGMIVMRLFRSTPEVSTPVQ